ncbi:MAG: hypothetical protein LLG02_03130 [Pelosinus sp.]|nr:hypothetical protein [Pelosinus sp.]
MMAIEIPRRLLPSEPFKWQKKQSADTTITSAYDMDKVEAEKVRQQILAEAVKNNWFIGGAHIVFPGIGKVQAVGGEYSFVPLHSPISLAIY